MTVRLKLHFLYWILYFIENLNENTEVNYKVFLENEVYFTSLDGFIYKY